MTKRQLELLKFYRDYPLRNGGIGASQADAAHALGVASNAEIFRMLNRLQDQGYVRRVPGRHRAIEIVRMPEGAQ